MKLPDHAVGTVIHATLRHEDLIPAFLEFLEKMGENTIVPIHLWLELEKRAKGLKAEVDELKDLDSEEGFWVLEGLYDAINEFLPEGYYFGATEGDGSDFGVWEIEEEED